MVKLSQESPLQHTWVNLLLTIIPGMNIVIHFVRRQIQVLVFLDRSGCTTEVKNTAYLTLVPGGGTAIYGLYRYVPL